MKVHVAALGLLVLAGLCGAGDFSRGDDRLGLPAPRIGLGYWLHSAPLEMDALRGKVLLIRWWTEGCSFCAATAPALRELNRKYARRGLIVIGIFHPRPPGDWSIERVHAASEHLGLTFPVALVTSRDRVAQQQAIEVDRRIAADVSILVEDNPG